MALREKWYLLGGAAGDILFEGWSDEPSFRECWSPDAMMVDVLFGVGFRETTFLALVAFVSGACM